jgi:two-component system, sensor histidine kinase RetS
VDDSALILKTTKRMLEKEGYEVKVAQNGAESLALMKKNHYQFVLTDIQMPFMDGIEATRRIREHEANCQGDGLTFPNQVIIGMSADSSVETKSQAILCGMDSFLPKPVHESKLRSVLAEISSEEKC